jgi:hypothetical protein
VEEGCQVVVDPTTGAQYYGNVKTGETRWEPPSPPRRDGRVSGAEQAPVEEAGGAERKRRRAQQVDVDSEHDNDVAAQYGLVKEYGPALPDAAESALAAAAAAIDAEDDPKWDVDTVPAIPVPTCAKLLSLIQRTAAFVAANDGDGGSGGGGAAEAALRAQNKPALAFLEPTHASHRYFRMEVDLALAGTW